MADNKNVDVVIVGAGAAGLAAAWELSKAGITVALLEARSRIGGRIFTVRDPKVLVPIELGAEFLHGQTPITNEVLHSARLSAHEITGEHWRAKDGKFRMLDDYWDDLDTVMSHLDPNRTPDQSFDEYLRSELTTYIRPRTRRLAREFVEGFHAADTTRISEQSLAQGNDNQEDRMGRITEGYDTLTNWIAKEVEDTLVLDTVVKRIVWDKHSVSVEVQSTDGPSSSVYTARRVIITVPLGVLQQSPGEMGAIEFIPAIPEVKNAVSQLTMGHVVRITLAFTEPFWETRLRNTPKESIPYNLSFLHGRDTKFLIWWTRFPVRAPLLIGWAGGPGAESLLLEGEDRVRGEAVASLAQLTTLTTDEIESLLVGSWMYDWSADPFARGAYAYALVGGAQAAGQLARPIQDTIFFAGEATATEGKNATVEGALATGRQTARSVRCSLD